MSIVWITLCSALTLLASSCGSHNQANETSTTALDMKTDTLCFRQVIGRDSVRLQLFTKGSRITGSLALRPYEKDRAQGPIIGVRTGDEITADWQRSGEGVTQTYVVNLVMAADTVRFQDGERVEKGGKWVLKAPDKGFAYKLAKSDCN